VTIFPTQRICGDVINIVENVVRRSREEFERVAFGGSSFIVSLRGSETLINLSQEVSLELFEFRSVNVSSV
jgi:hypothetical protein